MENEEGKKTKEDPFKLLEMISRGKADITGAFDYMPFAENDVLTVENTSKSIFILLKNGTVISLKISNQGGFKKYNENKNNFGLPQQVKFTVSVVDVVCGKDHCLAKGKNNKIYSWGSNSYGQLGLIGFPTNPNSEKGEPSEILALSSINVEQIFAANNSSFVTTDDRKLFGWGSNEYGQLGKYDKNQTEKKYPVPIPLHADIRFEKEFTLFRDKRVKKLFISELDRASSSLSEILELNKNKHLYSKEHELREELEKLKLKKTQLQGVRTNVEEYDSLIRDIQSLIVNLEDRINVLELKSKNEFGEKMDANNINFFENQIQFLTEKEKAMEDSIRKADSQADKGKLKIKMAKTNIKEKEGEDKSESDKTKNDSNNPNQTAISHDDRLIKVSEIISRVNTELQFHKHVVLSSHLKLEEETKKKELRVKKLKEYIKTFEKVTQLTNTKIDNLMVKSSVNEVSIILQKIQNEIPNFFTNSIKNLNKINDDSDSLLSKLSKARANLSDLEEKMGNIGGDNRSSTVIKINEMFHRNILLAKQNNILMSQVVHCSKGLYNNILEKIVRNDNPPNFNYLKNKIEKIKKGTYKKEQIVETQTPIYENLELEEDVKEIQSDESFNY